MKITRSIHDHTSPADGIRFQSQDIPFTGCTLRACYRSTAVVTACSRHGSCITTYQRAGFCSPPIIERASCSPPIRKLGRPQFHHQWKLGISVILSTVDQRYFSGTSAVSTSRVEEYSSEREGSEREREASEGVTRVHVGSHVTVLA